MDELVLHDTLTGEKRPFVPKNANRVTMYVCGPTVYNFAHIGNARPVVVFDCLYRMLQTRYKAVIYARNITDIDDKIIKAAFDSDCTIEEITEGFIHKYREDMSNLNSLAPTVEPLATEHIEEMIELICVLLETGNAYISEDHAIFSVESMPEYGALSGRKLGDMMAGARVEVASYKRHPSDFVLWKPSDDGEPGWHSPWGFGRPGWHLECSAMIRKHLGETIDIHGGGQDLIFPHHENERAQSCCANGSDFVRYWIHNGYVDINGEKMSKSLGNVRTVRELLKHYPGEVLRFALLSAHYRTPLNFSDEVLQSARSVLDSLYLALRPHKAIQVTEISPRETPVYKALLDDLNTPVAIASLHSCAKILNKVTDRITIERTKSELLVGARLLGLLSEDPEVWLKKTKRNGMEATDINKLIVERQEARIDKNFERADQIRAELESSGVIIEDGPTGTTWRRNN